MLHSEEDILQAVQEDEWMMDVLRAASTLELRDWWVCAGFVRSKVWDMQHGYSGRTPLADVDVIYFDSSNAKESNEKALEATLMQRMPAVPWSVKNQARMHTVNGVAPYTSASDGMAKFPETATALGLSLNTGGEPILCAPHGIQDALTVTVRPTPHFLNRPELHAIYEKRVASKRWEKVWPQLRIIPIANPAAQ
ncbi:nucleotidyltransferase family protein [Paenibacillus sp. NFR01]|uniref:nucleotidyltransferase family protein n=1 Tax=Paenibacillus sp. NFR01 TaxID=1566279 RepID=UPI0008C9F90B|nr:nucleotidyltransferase family protein [Paenibacillus sp. NFR01]SEU23912.1 hypothetical protein SAMN03159358_4260 [Paenibacillus sp. NFR01]